MQWGNYTIGSVRLLGVPLHNSCMAKSENKPVDTIAKLAGERIAGARKTRNWTQKDLAAATGWNEDKPSQGQKNALSSTRIANFEQGSRRVGLEEAKILERVLGSVAPFWMGVISEQEAAVLSALRKSNTGRNAALAHRPEIEQVL